MKIKQLLVLTGFALLTSANAQAQTCDDCVNIAPCGDMSCITTSGAGSLNTLGLPWKSSHGSPNYGPGFIWIWSYNNNGEGVYYDGVTFLAGHTYCITFDTQTQTNTGGAPNPMAGFNVMATNSMTPAEIPGCCMAIPPDPMPNQLVGSQSWTPLPNPGSTTFSYTFTATSNWSQLWFHPFSPTLPQVELTLQNLRICDITVSDPCEFDISLDHEWYDCYSHFSPVVSLAPGLTVVGYHWDFGDGSTSDEATPTHFYTTAGVYNVTLTVLVINADGECCARTITKQVQVEACDPCDLGKVNISYTTDECQLTYQFTALAPNSPGFVYHWDFGDGTTGTGHDVTHTYGSPGPYVVTLTVYYYNVEQGICCSKTYTYEVNGDSGGGPGVPSDPAPTDPDAGKSGFYFPEHLRERPVMGQGIELFPNPSDGQFTALSNDGSDIESVTVYDLSGRLIQTVTGGKTHVTIDLSSEKPGSYEVKVVMKDGSSSTHSLIRR